MWLWWSEDIPVAEVIMGILLRSFIDRRICRMPRIYLPFFLQKEDIVSHPSTNSLIQLRKRTTQL